MTTRSVALDGAALGDRAFDRRGRPRIAARDEIIAFFRQRLAA
jgi:hypothetical protein